MRAIYFALLSSAMTATSSIPKVSMMLSISYTDITENSFRWEYMQYHEDGSKELFCEILAKRIR